MPRSHGQCLLALKLSFGQQEEHGLLEHALVVLIPTQTMLGHELIPCHTPPSTIKYLGSDYIAVDLTEQEQGSVDVVPQCSHIHFRDRIFQMDSRDSFPFYFFRNFNS